MSDRTCLACDKPIDPSRRADATVCGPACRNWAQRHPGEKRPVGPFSYVCQYEPCGKTFTREKLCGKRPRFCSDSCWDKYRYCNLRDEFWWRDRDIELVRKASREWASRNKAHLREYRVEHWEDERVRGRDYGARRRAQMHTTAVEQFTHLEIFERDGWVCQLCDRAVDSSLRHPDPDSASLDHRIPLSRGGFHTRGNVQLAHLSCNLRKHARL